MFTRQRILSGSTAKIVTNLLQSRYIPPPSCYFSVTIGLRPGAYLLRNCYAIPPGCNIIVISTSRAHFFSVLQNCYNYYRIVTKQPQNCKLFLYCFSPAFDQNIHQFDQIIHSRCQTYVVSYIQKGGQDRAGAGWARQRTLKSEKDRLVNLG